MGRGGNHTWSTPAIYDTNIWVFGLTEELDAATELIDAAVEADQFVTVPAYVFEETRVTFESGRVDADKIDDHLTDFAALIHGNPNISDPSMEAVSKMDVFAIRQSAQAQAFGASTRSQPKDAPILWRAYEIAQEGRDVTIYTADEEFSTCSPPPVDEDGTVEMEFVT